MEPYPYPHVEKTEQQLRSWYNGKHLLVQAATLKPYSAFLGASSLMPGTVAPPSVHAWSRFGEAPLESVDACLRKHTAAFIAAFRMGSSVDADNCVHIATATLGKVDILVSWNFKHIVNIFRSRGYNSVNLRLGHPTLEIRSPKDVVGYENEG